MKDLIQNLKHYFYAAKDGEWHFGYYGDKDKDIKFIDYYSIWHDGRHRVLWIWKFSIENYY